MIYSGRCSSPLIIPGRCPSLQLLLSLGLTSRHLRNPCSRRAWDHRGAVPGSLLITLGANRQLIAQLFPTVDRSAFIALDRQWIASFGVGSDCLWWHTGSLSLLWSTSTRSPEPTMATPRKS